MPQNESDIPRSCNTTQELSEPDFAFLFDIDGVIARGSKALPEALEMFELIRGQDGTIKIPYAFVTNACSKAKNKVDWLSSIIGEEIAEDALIQAPTPLSMFKDWKKKFCLFIGQDDIEEIAKELGFTNICLIEDIIDAYPLLDMVDHDNRRKVARGHVEKPFPRIEAVIMMGEPVKWESCLQLLIDLLVTNGKPDCAPDQYLFPAKHLPILACNMDLVFMAEACMPRFGHGAFLLCLESLYRKVTGHEIEYTSVIGKPSEITFRFAEHIANVKATKMGYKKPIRKLYYFGDNVDVDIIGANLYNAFLKRFQQLSGGRIVDAEDEIRFHRMAAVCSSRAIPDNANFMPQSACGMDSILVHTGVYKAKTTNEKLVKPSYVHRDFMNSSQLVEPTLEMKNCLQAVKYILKQENFNPKNH